MGASAPIISTNGNGDEAGGVHAVQVQGEDWRPQHAVLGSQRLKLGQQCKRLLDHCRLAWLRQHGLDAHSVLYVPASVSGENRLLLARPPV